MIRSASMAVPAAVAAAAVFHAVFFLLLEPLPGAVSAGGAPAVPKTYYMTSGGADSSMSARQVRTIASPVLFALPSDVGFSRELNKQRIETLRFIPKPAEPERYLAVDAVPNKTALDPQALMLTALLAAQGPAVPQDVYGAEHDRPSARRVLLAPELRERIVGGVILPPELNQETEKAWEVSAQLHVAADGFVEHVFIDRPLESQPLNMEILKLLYGLQFNPGSPLDGMVEIYSPEHSKPAGEAAP